MENKLIGRLLKLNETCAVGLVLDWKQINPGDNGCIIGVAEKGEILIQWHTSLNCNIETRIGKWTYDYLVEKELIIELFPGKFQFERYDLVETKNGMQMGIVRTIGFHQDKGWVCRVHPLSTMCNNEGDTIEILASELVKKDKISAHINNQFNGKFRMTLETKESFAKGNIVTRDEQVYLLQYYLRTNFEKIIELIDAYDKADSKDSVYEELVQETISILYDEYGIEDHKLLYEIVDMWVNEQ